MVAIAYPHIAHTSEGSPYVEEAGVKVELIVTTHDVGGMSAQAIVDAYPPLTLAQVYSALAYYHDNKAEMDRRIAEGNRIEREIKAELDSSPRLRERLRERGLLT
jgi:uncharacterized protein (DUF433 family)